MQQQTPPRRKIEVKIASINGERCPLSLKVGQTWILDRLTVEGMCPSAYNVLFPTIQTLRAGGAAPGSDGGVVRRVCADPKGLVVYELKVVE